MSKKNHRQIAHDNTTPRVEIYKTKNLLRMRKFDSNLIQNCSPKMHKFFYKKMAANLMEIFSPQRNAQNLAARRREGGKEEAVTLIHNSHPSLDFLPVLWVSLPCWPIIENTSGHLPSYFITYPLLVIEFF